MPNLAAKLSLRILSLSLVALGGVLVACGGGSLPDMKNGGQSKLMEKTFAGANKCNPKNHNRPFIIEWDATDMSSFQSHADGDIVVVKYEGCDLQVLEGCRDDSVKGALGSYKPVTWTSGSLEAMDISDENELYAKLPLGAASLGGRVESGEKFHMEYYVSGTRTATRDHLYRADLAKIPACQGATHYVYGYNLGAFALGSSSKLHGEINGSYFGFGAGAQKTQTSQADKKGGEISACKGDSAREVEDCKVPIRLTLREIDESDNPDVQAAQAPDTPAAMNLAGKLAAQTEQQKQADAHWEAAKTKMNSRDGKGCLAEMNQHDKLDTRAAAQSTSPQNPYYAMLRAQCLMLAGQCPAGKDLFRKAAMVQNGATWGADVVDRQVDGEAMTYCQGGSMSPRDQLAAAFQELQVGSVAKKLDTATCMKDYQTVKQLQGTVQPRDANDFAVKISGLDSFVPKCLANAGDCDKAFAMFRDLKREQMNNDPVWKAMPPQAQWWNDDTKLRANFQAQNPSCKK